MVIGVSYWSRRDAVDRAMLGTASLDLCKALKAADEVEDARFYWAAPDQVVFQIFAHNAEVLNTPPSADAARAMFALADLANRDRYEQWISPRTGMENYAMAGLT